MSTRTYIGKFEDIVRDRFEVARAERGDRKAIGWISDFVPLEVVYAAGMLPVRVVGTGGLTPRASAVLYSNNCSFVCSYVEEGLKGTYDFLAGFVAADSCMQNRRGFDVWSNHVKTPFVHLLNVPNSVSELTRGFFRNEVRVFKERLEEYFAVDISSGSLSRAVGVYNRTRSLLKQLALMRTTTPPRLSGTEALVVSTAGTFMDPERYNKLLEELVAELSRGQVESAGPDGVRLLLVGSEVDDMEFVRLLEGSGGVVVADDLCTGTRYCREQVDTTGDLLGALSDYYLTRSPCPRMSPAMVRLERIGEIAKSLKVDGVIFQKIKWCHIHGGSCPVVKDYVEGLGLPFLLLEREYHLAGSGQLKTRVEAFYEMVRR
ncbi:MAG: 2-hydroxyacyl-CoA dehydratase family protein [Chloroflexota bacterium]